MKVSEERLSHIVGAAGLEPCDWDAVWEGLMVGEVVSMAKELLALRKALSETVVYEAEINGVMSSVTKSHFEDCKKYGVKTRELIIKPTPPQ